MQKVWTVSYFEVTRAQREPFQFLRSRLESHFRAFPGVRLDVESIPHIDGCYKATIEYECVNTYLRFEQMKQADVSLAHLLSLWSGMMKSEPRVDTRYEVALAS